MLRESTFYQPVTSDEMQKVVAAMTREFRGTGNWYRCRNGHPFTVGECGMPMQTARCPQCGEVVGGQSHQAAEGVTRAGDIERFCRYETVDVLSLIWWKGSVSWLLKQTDM